MKLLLLSAFLLAATLFLGGCTLPQVIYLDGGGYPQQGYNYQQPSMFPDAGQTTMRCAGYGQTPNFGTGGCF